MTSHKRHIYLIGFSGSGKSTVGPLLAKKLRRPFVDIDQVVERQSRRTIADIFAREGEAHFRRLESDTIRDASTRPTPCVIALGGGALKSTDNRRTVRQSGLAVYLCCAIPELHRRLANQTDRPLLHADGENLRQRISRLLNQRRPTYQAAAEMTIFTTHNRPQEVAREIIRRLGR